MNSVKKVSVTISQFHVLRSFFERYVIQLQEYSTNNMSLDSFLLQDEMLLDFIEEFNGFQQRAHSERVLEMLELEMNILEIIEEIYDWLVQYTKGICLRSQDLGLGDIDYNVFVKSQLLKEQQRFTEKMRMEEKRIKNRRKGLAVYTDDNSNSDSDSQSLRSPEPGRMTHDHFTNEMYDKENIHTFDADLRTPQKSHIPVYYKYSPITNAQDLSPFQTRSRRSLSKPMTPIQKVVTPAPPDNEERDTQVRNLKIQFRQFLVKEAYQAISRLNDFAPHLMDIDSQIKRHKNHLEQHLLDAKTFMLRHSELGKQLETHNFILNSANVSRRAIFDHWRHNELVL